MNIHAVLHEAQTALAGFLSSGEAKLEAQYLLQHIMKVNRAWLISHENDALQPSIHAGFEVLLKRRLKGEPIAYILGYREFYGLKLKVTPDTLIPRPDTETLVEAALAKIPNSASCSILDLGTGTGAITLAIAKHRPQAHITATDTLQAALNIALENAQNLNITNINFVLSDWFSALNNEKYDVIVSNPPYIEQDDAHLQQGDLRFEPISALASGKEGLDAIRHIVKTAPQHLNSHGWLLLEHGYNQASEVRKLLTQHGFIAVSSVKDFGGNERVTQGCLI